MMPLSDVRCAALPYCLELQECGRYALLNRNYKPLGFVSRDYVNYSEYPILMSIRVTPHIAAGLSCSGSSDVRIIHLYSDDCVPTMNAESWDRYSDRLARLMRLKLIDESHHYLLKKGADNRRKNLAEKAKLEIDESFGISASGQHNPSPI